MTGYSPLHGGTVEAPASVNLVAVRSHSPLHQAAERSDAEQPAPFVDSMVATRDHSPLHETGTEQAAGPVDDMVAVRDHSPLHTGDAERPATPALPDVIDSVLADFAAATRAHAVDPTAATERDRAQALRVVRSMIAGALTDAREDGYRMAYGYPPVDAE